jgi:hypothetical protein
MSEAYECAECGQRVRAVRYRLDPRTAQTNAFTVPCGHSIGARDVARAYRHGGFIDHPKVTGATLIAAERERQQTEEGYTPERDLALDPGDLGWAAWCYLDAAAPDAAPTQEPPPMWPWSKASWKPERSPLRLLIIAGALVAAEIDRRLARGERP